MTPVEAWVSYPDSEAIAADLQASGMVVCRHGRNPCLLRCGVRGVLDLPPFPVMGVTWEVIPRPERVTWFTNLTGKVPPR